MKVDDISQRLTLPELVRDFFSQLFLDGWKIPYQNMNRKFNNKQQINSWWCRESVKQGVPLQKLSKALVDTSTTGSLRMRGYGTP